MVACTTMAVTLCASTGLHAVLRLVPLPGIRITNAQGTGSKPSRQYVPRQALCDAELRCNTTVSKVGLGEGWNSTTYLVLRGR